MTLMTLCPTWSEHEWGAPRFIESGRHPTMGRFNRYTVTCQKCPKQTLQTDWLDLGTPQKDVPHGSLQLE